MRGLVLCCGAGGATEGLRQAGLEATVVVDVWALALQSHAMNHPNAEHIKADIRDLVGSLGRFDWIQGSAPCPEFSQVGPKRGKDADTSIIEACLEIRDEAKPGWWAWENVPGAAPTFQRLGEAISFIRACDHGLNHERRRVYAGRFAVPMPTNPVPVLFDTPLASDGKRGAKPRNFEAGKNLRTFLGGRPVQSADVIGAMGFPADYKLAGNKKQRLRQLGNAVPPPVAKALGEAQRDSPAGPKQLQLVFR